MRILITGGSGTIGKAFIREFPEHTYYNVSRNEKFLTDLMREHPKVKNFIGNIEDEGFLMRVFNSVKPINRAINKCKSDGGGFVCSYKMKSVNMFELAKVISDDVEVVGLRPGEKLDEDLISVKEIPFTYVHDDMIYIYNQENLDENKLRQGYSSVSAEKMTVKEMKELIWNTK